MKKNILLAIIAVMLFSGFLGAQAVWQNEVVLRKQDTVSWNKSTAVTANGDILVLWEKGGQGSLGLFLHKINPQGEAVWDEDILISGTPNMKPNPAITPDGMGNFYIKWDENIPSVGSRLNVAKMNADGQFLWDAQSVNVFTGPWQSSSIQDDGNGGLYVVYGKQMIGNDTDIYLQHLNAVGDLLLPAGGMSLNSSPGLENVLFLCLAVDNNLIVGFNLPVNNSQKIRILRMQSDYQMAWDSLLAPGSNTGYEQFWSVVTNDNSNFVIYWTEFITNQSCSYIQKFDLNAFTYYSTAVQVGVTSIYSWQGAMSINSDNEIFTVFHTGESHPFTNVIRKFDWSANSLWGDGVSLPDSISTLLKPIPDDNGGCFLTMKYKKNGLSTNSGYAIQHFNESGNMLWEGLGEEIDNNISNYYSDMDVVVTDRFTILWINQIFSNTRLQFQIRNPAGQLISPESILIRTGLAGRTYLKGNVPRENDVLVFWNDSRNYAQTYTTDQTYYQIVNPDGTTDLEDNGALLVSQNASSNNYQTVKLSNGTIVFIWDYPSNNPTKIMGQAVSPAGNILWEPEGRTLVTFSPGTYGRGLVVSGTENDIYLAWYDTTETGYQTVIQKITNGIPQWELPGRNVDFIIPSLGTFQTPLFYQNGFLVILGNSGEGSIQNINVIYLTPEGTVDASWDGNVIISGTMSYLQDSTLDLHAAIWNGNLLVVYRQLESDDNRYQFSVTSPAGVVLTTNQYFVNDTNQELDLSLDLTSQDMVISLRQFGTVPHLTRYGYSKVDTNFSHPWGMELIPAFERLNAPTATQGINGFGDGGYIIHWLHNYIFYGGYIDENGTFTSPSGGEILTQQCYSNPQINNLGNELYIAWSDFKVNGNYSLGCEIRIQKYANPNVSISEETVPLVLSSLECFPNPVHNALTIKLNIDSKAVNKLGIYNLKGQKVMTISDAMLEKGEHTFTWDGRDAQDKQVAAGVYLVRSEDGKHISTKKIVYVK